MILGVEGHVYFLSTGSRASWGSLNTSTGLSEGAARSNLTEMTNVRGDVTINDAMRDIDVTVKGAGSVQHDYGLPDWTVTLPLQVDTGNSAYMNVIKAILAARANKTPIAIAILSGTKSAIGSFGYWADWIVSQPDKEEPLQDAQMMRVQLKLAKSTVAPERVYVSS
jgi:hypothetical protein